ncbi:hypothetical protein GCM10020256_72710 [Streptomyces thermocoprophilus]
MTRRRSRLGATRRELPDPSDGRGQAHRGGPMGLGASSAGAPGSSAAQPAPAAGPGEPTARLDPKYPFDTPDPARAAVAAPQASVRPGFLAIALRGVSTVSVACA